MPCVRRSALALALAAALCLAMGAQAHPQSVDNHALLQRSAALLSLAKVGKGLGFFASWLWVMCTGYPRRCVPYDIMARVVAWPSHQLPRYVWLCFVRLSQSEPRRAFQLWAEQHGKPYASGADPSVQHVSKDTSPAGCTHFDACSPDANSTRLLQYQAVVACTMQCMQQLTAALQDCQRAENPCCPSNMHRIAPAASPHSWTTCTTLKSSRLLNPTCRCRGDVAWQAHETDHTASAAT